MIISSIKNTDWFKNSSYNGGSKKEETEKADDFKPLKLEDKEVKKDDKEVKKEDKEDFKPIVLEDKPTEEKDVDVDDEPSTTITYDKKGNLIVVSFIPKNKIKLTI